MKIQRILRYCGSHVTTGKSNYFIDQYRLCRVKYKTVIFLWLFIQFKMLQWLLLWLFPFHWATSWITKQWTSIYIRSVRVWCVTPTLTVNLSALQCWYIFHNKCIVKVIIKSSIFIILFFFCCKINRKKSRLTFTFLFLHPHTYIVFNAYSDTILCKELNYSDAVILKLNFENNVCLQKKKKKQKERRNSTNNNL